MTLIQAINTPGVPDWRIMAIFCENLESQRGLTEDEKDALFMQFCYAMHFPQGIEEEEEEAKILPRLISLSARDQRIVADYRSGLSLLQIGNMVGLSTERVRQILMKAGVKRRPGGCNISKLKTEETKRDESA